MLDFHEGLAAERSDGLPWVDFGVGAWPAERQHSMWDTRTRQVQRAASAEEPGKEKVELKNCITLVVI